MLVCGRKRDKRTAVKVRRPWPHRQQQQKRVQARMNGGNFLEDSLQTLKSISIYLSILFITSVSINTEGAKNVFVF